MQKDGGAGAASDIEQQAADEGEVLDGLGLLGLTGRLREAPEVVCG
jgi:hypothetical protein